MSWQTDRVKEPRNAKPYCKPSPTGSIRRLEIHSRSTSTSQFAIQHQQQYPLPTTNQPTAAQTSKMSSTLTTSQASKYSPSHLKQIRKL